MENLFELMQEYNLTLRRIPNIETSSYAFPKYPTKEEIDNAYEVIINEMNEETFKKWNANAYMTNCRWHNGFVITKRTKKTQQREGGWLVKQDNGHGSIQNWNREYDYFGKTPKEAIMKAVKDVEKQKMEIKEKRLKAGLEC